MKRNDFIAAGFLEDVDYRGTDFGDAEVVGVAAGDFAAAVAAGVFVKPDVVVSHAYFGLEVEVLVEYPLVAVGGADADEIAFEAVVLDFGGEVGTAEPDAGVL